MLVLALEDLLLERDRDLIDQVGTLKARTGSENSTELLKSVSLPMPWGLVLFFLSLYIYMLSHFIYFTQQCVSFVLPRMRLLQAPHFHNFFGV